MGKIVVIALLLQVCKVCSGTWQFAYSVVEHVGEHLGTEYLALISKDGFEADFNEVSLNTPTSFISYGVNRDEKKVAEKLKQLRLAGYLNMIIFLDDGHGELIKMMVNELQLFNSGVTGFCHDIDFAGKDLKLRLDTKLYCYSDRDSLIGLWETYAVNGISIENQIGTWNESFGLSVPAPNMVNIWHRRTSLHGLTVNVASINRRYLHEIYYEGNPLEYRPPRNRDTNQKGYKMMIIILIKFCKNIF